MMILIRLDKTGKIVSIGRGRNIMRIFADVEISFLAVSESGHAIFILFDSRNLIKGIAAEWLLFYYDLGLRKRLSLANDQ